MRTGKIKGRGYFLASLPDPAVFHTRSAVTAMLQILEYSSSYGAEHERAQLARKVAGPVARRR
jgi:hypothetical protein